MLLDVSVLYHDQQYRTAGKTTLGLERYSGTGYVLELQPDGSGSALLCSSRISSDNRKAQYNVAVSWSEPLTLVQAMQLKLIMEKITPQDAGQMELTLPMQKVADEKVSTELLSAVLEAMFTNSCLFLDRGGPYGEEDVCAVLRCLPRPHCTVTVGFSLPTRTEPCTITMADAPVTIVSGKWILRMGDISNRYLSMAKVIVEADWPIRQYALERNTFLLYASLVAMREGNSLNQEQLGELVNAWEVLSPTLQKQILRQLVDRAGQNTTPLRREIKPTTRVFRRMKRPDIRHILVIPAVAVCIYLAADLSFFLFVVLFGLMWFYWNSQ